MARQRGPERLVEGRAVPSGGRRRVLIPYIVNSSFIRRDREILDSIHAVRMVPCAGLAQMVLAVRTVPWADCVFCWFGSIRFLPAVIIARLLRRKVIVVAGGYDVASLSDIRYGNMATPVPRFLGRILFAMAHAVACVSDAAVRDARSLARVPSHRIRRIYHGFEDPGASPTPDAAAKERLVLTVAPARRDTLRVKGLATVAQVSRLLPDVRFVLVGQSDPETLATLRAASGPNLEFRGFLDPSDLAALYQRAAVVLQPSLHESFGCAVAEAMLYNCVPVVSGRGGLSEVVGDAGFYADPEDALTLAKAVQLALDDGLSRIANPRDRILRLFSLAARREAVLRLVSEVCG